MATQDNVGSPLKVSDVRAKTPSSTYPESALSLNILARPYLALCLLLLNDNWALLDRMTMASLEA